MQSYADKKAKVLELLEKNGFVEILEKPITNPKGRIGVPKKFANCNAIILISPPQEAEGRGSK